MPEVVARRTIALPLGRSLEIVAVESPGGLVDVWCRMRNAAGLTVGQFVLRPSVLRDVARALTSLAGELGEP